MKPIDMATSVLILYMYYIRVYAQAHCIPLQYNRRVQTILLGKYFLEDWLSPSGDYLVLQVRV
jgi:hypothetical protein